MGTIVNEPAITNMVWLVADSAMTYAGTTNWGKYLET